MQPLFASDARTNLDRLLDQAAGSHQPIVITGERHDSVLLSAADWQTVHEALSVLSMRGSIQEGRAESVDACAKGLVKVLRMWSHDE
jgi:PHD/YefM family antitoxin component YafN of YafNO toxin-antitoxin module